MTDPHEEALALIRTMLMLLRDPKPESNWLPRVQEAIINYNSASRQLLVPPISRAWDCLNEAHLTEPPPSVFMAAKLYMSAEADLICQYISVLHMMVFRRDRNLAEMPARNMHLQAVTLRKLLLLDPANDRRAKRSTTNDTRYEIAREYETKSTMIEAAIVRLLTPGPMLGRHLVEAVAICIFKTDGTLATTSNAQTCIRRMLKQGKITETETLDNRPPIDQHDPVATTHEDEP